MALTSALQAYGNAGKIAQSFSSSTPSAGTSGANPASGMGTSFRDLLESTAQNALNHSRQTEGISANALIGKADLADVVTAVSQAEVTLQTVLSVRDKVVSSIQEIMRMPV